MRAMQKWLVPGLVFIGLIIVSGCGVKAYFDSLFKSPETNNDIKNGGSSLPSPMPTPPPGTSAGAPAKMPAAQPLGRLVDQCPRVSIRRKSTLVWEDVTEKFLSLFPFDAVRTYAGACANIELGDGSMIYARENSLIVLNPEVLRGTHRSQRAIVRAGKVVGETNDEIWIMTSAAILKLIAKKAEKNRSNFDRQ